MRPTTTGAPGARRPRLGRSGVSLVELIVAMFVLTVGMLGMAAGTSWTIRAVEIARVETERAAVLQSAIEQVRAVPFDNIADGTFTQGAYQVAWRITAMEQHSRTLEFLLRGPGRAVGSYGVAPPISLDATDVLTYRIIRP